MCHQIVKLPNRSHTTADKYIRDRPIVSKKPLLASNRTCFVKFLALVLVVQELKTVDDGLPEAEARMVHLPGLQKPS